MKYAIEQRVCVPGQSWTQGVVIDATEALNGFPVYTLRFVTDKGEVITASVGEGDLHEANKPVLGMATPKKKSTPKRKR